MIMGLVGSTVAAIGGLITAVMNFLTDRFLTPPLKATLRHLEEAELKSLTGGESERFFFSRHNCIYSFIGLLTLIGITV